MNRITLLLTVLYISVLFGCQKTIEAAEEDKPVAVEEVSEVSEDVLRHVVLFKFKDDAPATEVELINQAFLDLPNTIEVIKDFEWGLNDSPEDLDQGFTHCYMVSFSSEQDRDSVYAPHPQHQAFVELLGPHLDKVLVVDYWAK